MLRRLCLFNIGVGRILNWSRPGHLFSPALSTRGSAAGVVRVIGHLLIALALVLVVLHHHLRRMSTAVFQGVHGALTPAHSEFGVASLALLLGDHVGYRIVKGVLIVVREPLTVTKMA